MRLIVSTVTKLQYNGRKATWLSSLETEMKKSLTGQVDSCLRGNDNKQHGLDVEVLDFEGVFAYEGSAFLHIIAHQNAK